MQRRCGSGFCSCFSRGAQQLGGMSLNRSEQRIFEYFGGHADERQFWQDKVRGIAKIAADHHVAVVRLEVELWRYYVERSGVASPFREAARVEGLARTSMKNLSELLLRLWVEPTPKRKPAVPGGISGKNAGAAGT